MTTALVMLSAAAVGVLEALGATGLAGRYRQVLRKRGRQALILAARLRVELIDELDHIDERHRALQVYVRRLSAGERYARGATVFRPEPLDRLYTEKLKALRVRVDRAYDGVGDLSRREIEGRCQVFVEIAAEVGSIMAEIASREEAWGHCPAPRTMSPRTKGAHRHISELSSPVGEVIPLLGRA